MALDDDDWDASKTDYDPSRPTEVAGAWEGKSAYVGRNLLTEGGMHFRNSYDCPACDCHWRDDSDAVCDDRCPGCNLSCSPSESEDLKGEAAWRKANRYRIAVRRNKGSAGRAAALVSSVPLRALAAYTGMRGRWGCSAVLKREGQSK